MHNNYFDFSYARNLKASHEKGKPMSLQYNKQHIRLENSRQTLDMFPSSDDRISWLGGFKSDVKADTSCSSTDTFEISLLHHSSKFF